jgi:predicted thioesterase
MDKYNVTIPTLESHNHIVGDIERGVKTYNKGGVEFQEQEPNHYWARVPHKGNDTHSITVTFSRDRQDIDQHYCSCSWRAGGNPVCRHIVAVVLSIQGGFVETKITLNKTATVTAMVDKTNTARVVGSGSLDVFATPMLAAHMERAACEVLADTLAERQTSVGTFISVNYTAASPIGAIITFKATITSVRGRKIEFYITANDNKGEVGIGQHTRVIVDAEKFMMKLR